MHLPTNFVLIFYPTALCPAGYVAGPDDHCYKFVKELAAWDEARRSCQEGAPPNAGDLVIIDTPEELAYIMGVTQGSEWWIGK